MEAVSIGVSLKKFGKGREEIEQQLVVDEGGKEDTVYFFFFF